MEIFSPSRQGSKTNQKERIIIDINLRNDETGEKKKKKKCLPLYIYMWVNMHRFKPSQRYIAHLLLGFNGAMTDVSKGGEMIDDGKTKYLASGKRLNID